MIKIQLSKKNEIYNTCQQSSVTVEGKKQRYFSCGEVYTRSLDDIVLDVQMSKSHTYINKILFFLSA